MRLRDEKVYLKPNILAEPLLNRWYAWALLIAPATAAMYVANSHLKIMQSFVAAPQVHAAALRNPAMRGGPFIHYDASRVSDIKALIDSTTRDQALSLELAGAINQLSQLLSTEANGYSLEPLYQKIPEMLKGYVELVYDLEHHPSIRFIEGLLYKTPFYDESLQSISLSACETDERPFALSSPYLAQEGSWRLHVPFRDEAVDELFKMKTEPQPFSYIRERLKIEENELEVCSSFFTEETPRRAISFTGDSVRVRYFGHACILIESKDATVLFDPLISYEIDGPLPRYTYNDLPDSIDYVLITHNHQDHCMLETLLQIRHKVKNLIVPKNNGGSLADPSLKLMLQNIGFKRVSEIDEMESIPLAGGSITGLPFLGEHADLNIRSKLAYLVELEGKSILCAADSNNLEPQLYKHIHQLTGDIDLLFIGMECDGGPLSWLYGPLLTKPLGRKLDQSRRLNGSDYEKGMALVNQFKPGQVYVYAMGQEPWLTYLTSIQYTADSRPIIDSSKLVEECRKRGITSERLYGCKEIRL
jgi:L-ascorbate metabolism protein UlaG (beta-lactamase superfamily)